MSLNEALAQQFRDISRMLEVLGEDKFRVLAHEKAARAIEGLTVDVATLSADRAALLEIEGIGAKTADKIIEYCKTGRIVERDELAANVPAGVVALMDVPGLGPKTVALLWKERGVTDIPGLKKIIDDGSILTLPRMGKKTVENIKASLAFMEQAGERLPLGLAQPVAEAFVDAMSRVSGVKKAAFAGSLRRGRETIGDIDVLVATTDAEAAHEAFRALPGIEQVLVAGETKSSVRARASVHHGRFEAGHDGPMVQVDLRTVAPGQWGAALAYFTGSKEHNVRLRERALKMGYTLNEYGLFPLDEEKSAPQHRGVKPVAAATEEDIYEALRLPFLPPEVREDQGELDAQKSPNLIELQDVKAELHAHTIASDGVLSLDALIEEALARGFHTIAVTDHSRSAIQANGLSVERLRKQAKDVADARARHKGIQILHGSEVDILADGRLDFDDDVLQSLDIVIASPHAALSQEPATATKRLIKAIENPCVNILGHPTGRLIGRRKGLEPDMAEVIAAAKEHGVALEINAHWLRLDLRDAHVRAAVEAGCAIAINCDVHSAEDFDHLRYGVITARRGWLTAAHCVNAWSAKKTSQWLKARRGR